MNPQAPIVPPESSEVFPVVPQSVQSPQSPLSPQKQKDSHWISILAMAIFVVLSLGVVAFLYYQNQALKSMLASQSVSQSITQSPSPTAIPNISDVSSGWESYENSKLGFYLKYPIYLSLKEGIDEITITEIMHLTGSMRQDYSNKMTISTEKVAQDVTVSDWLATLYGKETFYPEIKSSVKEITIDNTKGISFDIPGAAAYLDHNILLIKGGVGYRIHTQGLDWNGGQSKLFDQISSTFLFAPATPSPTYAKEGESCGALPGAPGDAQCTPGLTCQNQDPNNYNIGTCAK